MTAERRRTCRWCETPLTRKQMARQGQYCSRSCAKAQYHAQHPDAARRAGHRAWATNRTKYIARLKAALGECRSLGEAYRRGYVNGYKVGSGRRRRGHTARPAA